MSGALSSVAQQGYSFVEFAGFFGIGAKEISAMLKEYGLVPSLLTAIEDPYVAEAQPFWGGQAVWQTILEPLPRVAPSRGTPFFGDADGIMRTVQTGYLSGSYDSAQAALDDAAHQIELVTGLPVAQ